MLSQCSKCGLSKSTGPMGSVLPQCQCDWKMSTAQRTWVELTENEIEKLFQTVDRADEGTVFRFAAALQAKLKERNT